jgi:hypothetical protein
MRQRYDASSKWLIETFARELLRLAGVGPVASVKVLPGELVQSRQLPDGLIEVRLAGRPDPVLCLIEINTYSYKATANELLDDVLLTYLSRGVVPELIAVTLSTKDNVRVAPELRLNSPLGHTRLEAGWRVVNLWELNANDFLPLTDPGLAPWVPLMKIDGPAEPVLQQCKDVIDQKTTGGQHDNLLGVTRVLASLKWNEELLKKLFAKEGKMLEIPLLKEWFQEKELAAYQRAILEGLEVRFGAVPPDVSAAVRVVTDDARITALRKASYTCASLDEFRRILAAPQAPAGTNPTN